MIFNVMAQTVLAKNDRWAVKTRLSRRLRIGEGVTIVISGDTDHSISFHDIETILSINTLPPMLPIVSSAQSQSEPIVRLKISEGKLCKKIAGSTNSLMA